MMVSPLNDSHLGVYHASQEDYFPAFSWDMIEGKLRITKVSDSISSLAPHTIAGMSFHADLRG